MTRIRWRRRDDGFVESHDGRWRISPLYWACTRPQMYELRRGDEVVASDCSTQREAKEVADDLVAREEEIARGAARRRAAAYYCDTHRPPEDAP